jgi:hypothetical protein
MTSHVRRDHRHYRGSGHFWQGRFKAFPVQSSDEHDLTVLRYVERNPLWAGLVTRSEDWEWSSLKPTVRSGLKGLLSAGPIAIFSGPLTPLTKRYSSASPGNTIRGLGFDSPGGRPLMFDYTLTDVLILGLACFRITHFLTSDTLTMPFRAWLVDERIEPDALGRMVQIPIPKPPAWRGVLGTLITCTWCLGVWVAAGLVVGLRVWKAGTAVVVLVAAVAGAGIVLEMLTLFLKVNSFNPTAAQLAALADARRRILGEPISGATPEPLPSNRY